MGKSNKQTIGYRYFMSLQMGLCRGPIDELVQIKVGDLDAWPVADTPPPETTFSTYVTMVLERMFAPKGTVIEVTDDPDPTKNGVWIKDSSGQWVLLPTTTQGMTSSGDTYIHAQNLFGGEKKEGGIEGSLRVCMGEATQTTPPLLTTLVGGLLSGFRGVVTLVYDGLISCNNPYPKSWSFRVRRSKKGWQNGCWYPAKATIEMAGGAIHAMNPAHIIYEARTNGLWGKGKDPSTLDENSFIAAANTLCAEGFGLCIAWARQEDVDIFVQHVLDHIGAAFYTSRETGLETLRLIRDDYAPEDLPLYTPESGLLSIEDDDSSAQDTTYNEIIVNYVDPVRKEERSVRWQNIAHRQATGAPASTTTSYPGAPTAELALRLAARDGRIQASGLKRFKVKMDRRAWRIAPASVFRISDPSNGVENLVLRAGKIDDGTMTDGTITIVAMQDVFGLPSTVYITPPTPTWEPPSHEAEPTPDQALVEASWRDLTRELTASDLAEITEDQAYIGLLAMRPNGSALNYDLWTAPDGSALEDRAVGDFAPTATLAAAIGPYDTDIQLGAMVDLQSDLLGEALLITGEDGDEICKIVSLDLTTGAATVARGCVDTVPHSHGIGTRVWFFDNALTGDHRAYAESETVDARARTRTSSDVLSLGLAPEAVIFTEIRQARPYAPGNLLVNDAPALATTAVSSANDLVLTWTHRDRLLQADQLVSHPEASVGPEAGVTYTVRTYDQDDVLLTTDTGLTDTWTFDNAAWIAAGSPTTMRVELEAVRDGLTSWQKYTLTIDRPAAGWGLAWGLGWGGA